MAKSAWSARVPEPRPSLCGQHSGCCRSSATANSRRASSVPSRPPAPSIRGSNPIPGHRRPKARTGHTRVGREGCERRRVFPSGATGLRPCRGAGSASGSGAVASCISRRCELARRLRRHKGDLPPIRAHETRAPRLGGRNLEAARSGRCLICSPS